MRARHGSFAIPTCLLWRGLRATVWRWWRGGPVAAPDRGGGRVAFAASDMNSIRVLCPRHASPWDVMIDATAALGLLPIWAIQRRRRAKPIWISIALCVRLMLRELLQQGRRFGESGI